MEEDKEIPKRFFFTKGWGEKLFYKEYPLVMFANLISFGLIKDPIILLQTFDNEWKIYLNEKNNIYFVKEIQKDKDGIFVLLNDDNDIVNVISKNLENKTEIFIMKQFEEHLNLYYFLGWYKVPKNGIWKSYKQVGIQTIELKKSSEHKIVADKAKMDKAFKNKEKIEKEIDNFTSDIKVAQTLGRIIFQLNDAEKDIEISVPKLDKEKFFKLINFFEINIEYNEYENKIIFKFEDIPFGYPRLSHELLTKATELSNELRDLFRVSAINERLIDYRFRYVIDHFEMSLKFLDILKFYKIKHVISNNHIMFYY